MDSQSNLRDRPQHRCSRYNDRARNADGHRPGEMVPPERLDDLLDGVSVGIASVKSDQVVGLVPDLLDGVDQVADIETGFDCVAPARIDEGALPQQRCQTGKITTLTRPENGSWPNDNQMPAARRPVP